MLGLGKTLCSWFCTLHPRLFIYGHNQKSSCTRIHLPISEPQTLISTHEYNTYTIIFRYNIITMIKCLGWMTMASQDIQCIKLFPVRCLLRRKDPKILSRNCVPWSDDEHIFGHILYWRQNIWNTTK